MGAKDASTKVFLGRPEIFAEIFNFLFRLHGKKYTIEADSLEEMDSTVSLIIPEELRHLSPTGKICLERRNDIVRMATITDGCQKEKIILCVESQSFVRYCQPHHNTFYYSMREEQEIQQLARLHEQENSNDSVPRRMPIQRLTKDDSLHVIMVCVVYFGFTPWDAAPSLHDWRKPFFKDMKPYLTDTPTNVLSLVDQDDDQLKLMNTELRSIAMLLKNGKDKAKIKSFLLHDQLYSNLSGDAIRVINALFDLNFNVPIQEENNNMHPTIQAILDDERKEGFTQGISVGREQGISIGREQGISVGIQTGKARGIAETIREVILQLVEMNMDNESIQKICNVTPEQLHEYKKQLNLSSQQL